MGDRPHAKACGFCNRYAEALVRSTTVAFLRKTYTAYCNSRYPDCDTKCPYEKFETYISNGIRHYASFPTNVCKLRLSGYDCRALHYRKSNHEASNSPL